MATLIAHLVIGERVSRDTPRLRSTSAVHGAFLLGCVLVDANNYWGLGRHQTHLVRLSDGEAEGASEGSCAAFLRQRGELLLRPWDTLTTAEQAFVAGYLCHLAADEAWLDVSSGLLQDLGLPSWDDLPVPAEAMVVSFNALSQRLFDDFPTVTSALRDAAVPSVFSHVPAEAFERMWELARPYVLAGGELDAYLTLLQGQGKSDVAIETARRHVEAHRESASALITQAGGIEGFIEPGVGRAMGVVAPFWRAARRAASVEGQ